MEKNTILFIVYVVSILLVYSSIDFTEDITENDIENT